MENPGVSPQDWLEMTEEADQLLLQGKLEKIKAEMEGYKIELESLRNDSSASEKDIQSYMTAIDVTLELINRIERADEDFHEEAGRLKD